MQLRYRIGSEARSMATVNSL